jgi:hypothetical protein
MSKMYQSGEVFQIELLDYFMGINSTGGIYLLQRKVSPLDSTSAGFIQGSKQLKFTSFQQLMTKM